jgi:hypothetical protein
MAIRGVGQTNFPGKGFVEILFFRGLLIFFRYYEGEAAQGEHPLDPRFFINLLWVIAV